jgi:ribosome-associated protein
MFDKDALLNELTFKASRSSGAGGQHVNKVSSKIELFFNLLESSVFNEEQKELLQIKLQSRLKKEGVFMLQCDESRSQHKNKELVIKRFLELIEKSLFVPKERIPTKIPRAVIKKRLKSKRNIADKKEFRKKPDID